MESLPTNNNSIPIQIQKNSQVFTICDLENVTSKGGITTPIIDSQPIGPDPMILNPNTLDNYELDMDMFEPNHNEDPLHLRLRKKTDAQMKAMKDGPTRSKIRKFYKDQSQLIEDILAPLSASTAQEKKAQTAKANLAIYASFGANVVLLGLKLFSAIASGSLVIFATMADSFMDLLSGLILLWARRLARKAEIYRYPSGKGKYETVGIIVFGSLMATLSLELIVQSVTSLLGEPEALDLGLISLVSLGVVLGVKLALYLYCRRISDPSVSVLAMDHRNDLLLNGIGLGFAVLAQNYYTRLDPIGAILIALLILRSWASTVLEYCRLLVGKSADPSFLKRVTHIAMTHDSRIKEVDTVRAYHSGSKVIVEVDIVLPPDTMLSVAHDMGESLQVKLESLPNVERAYVHVDYDTTHKPEHGKSL